MEIAVVEDEPKLVSLLNDYLVKEGYTTRLYSDGSEALSALQDSLPDLILLDLMLPGTDGLTICREIRKTSEVPVIMMTARVDEIDRLLGLEIGADDYICKPFSPREVTRIYPDNRVVSDRTIDSHVKKLRQKIQSLDSQREYIHSVYGIGYKYEVEKVD